MNLQKSLLGPDKKDLIEKILIKKQILNKTLENLTNEPITKSTAFIDTKLATTRNNLHKQ